MTKLPNECRARLEAVHSEARLLVDSFILGNRKHVLKRLCEFETPAALAILSTMMVHCDEMHQRSLEGFLTEAT